MKTSFIATIFNEENNIKDLITSLLNQTKKIDEIIFVDNNSTDKTREIIKSYKNIKLLKYSGNRSKGRNFGIEHASGDIILVSDSGCILDKNWVKNITSGFKNEDISVVSGYYLPICNSIFQKCLATYTCVMPDKLNENTYLPSSRSIAFKKSAWKTIGGYPKNLSTCEDLIFAVRLKKHNFHFILVKDALVYWQQRKNLLSAFSQFFSYAKGDGKARYVRAQTPYLYLRYIVAVLLFYFSFKEHFLTLFIVLGSLYFFWAIYKNYVYIKSLYAIIYLPLLQLTSDIAVLAGMTVGLFLSFTN